MATPLQHSCLENPMDRGAWWAAVHGVAELDPTQHARMHKLYLYRTMETSLLLLQGGCLLEKARRRARTRKGSNFLKVTQRERGSPRT